MTIDDLKFDLKFEQSLFESKSNLDLSEVVIDIPGLNTFIPKKWIGFSNKEKDFFMELIIRRRILLLSIYLRTYLTSYSLLI